MRECERKRVRIREREILGELHTAFALLPED